MKPMSAIVIGLLFAALLTSCQKGLAVRLVNNTGSDSAVVVKWSHGDSRSLKVLQEEGARFEWPIGLSIQSGTNHWEYSSFPRVSPAHMDSRLFSNTLHAQVERDGTIYVRPSGGTGIITNFGVQPPGFPLKPAGP